VFEFAKEKFGITEKNKSESGSFNNLSESSVALRRMAAGASAGIISWTIAYPADIIKVNL
jgi:hypothetical protein